MLRSLLFSIATVSLAMGAPLIALSSTNSKMDIQGDLQTKAMPKSPNEELTCPVED